MVSKRNRYQKVNKMSDGYKRGIRWIDYGAKPSSKIKFLKKKPFGLRHRR